jgi:hypothetical protein
MSLNLHFLLSRWLNVIAAVAEAAAVVLSPSSIIISAAKVLAIRTGLYVLMLICI